MYQSSAIYSQWCLYYPSYDHPQLGDGWTKDILPAGKAPENKVERADQSTKADQQDTLSNSNTRAESKSPSREVPRKQLNAESQAKACPPKREVIDIIDVDEEDI